MNVKRLEGALLNYWIAKAAGLQPAPVAPRPGDTHDPDSGYWHPVTFSPGSDWSQAGALISGEWFAIEDMLMEWFGPEWPHIHAIVENPLKWFMRAYVATQYGNEVEEVDIPHSIQPAAQTLTPIRARGEPPRSRMTQWLSLIHW